MNIIVCKPNNILAGDYWVREGVFGTNIAVPINRFPIRLGVLERDTQQAFPEQARFIHHVYQTIRRVRAGDLVVIKRGHDYYRGTVIRGNMALWHFAESRELAGSGAVMYAKVDHFVPMTHVPLSVRWAMLRRLPIGRIHNRKLLLNAVRVGAAALN